MYEPEDEMLTRQELVLRRAERAGVRWTVYGHRPRALDGGGAACVAWLDPGEASGWCALDYDPGVLARTGSAVGSILGFETGTVLGDENSQVSFLLDMELDLAFRSGIPVTVGIEDFILRRSERSRNLLSPVRVASAFQYTLWDRGRVVVWQQPNEMAVVTAERLRLWKLWSRGFGTRDGAHARDALAHCLVWLKKRTGQGVGILE